MAINFNSNMDNYTQTAARSPRAKNFQEYTSKKKLQESGVLTEEQYKVLAKITGTFSFALHNDGRYVAVTLYHANTDPKYGFLVVDLQTNGVAEMPSIKEAKKAILEQVQEDAANAEAGAEEAGNANGDGSEEGASKGKRGKKTDK